MRYKGPITSRAAIVRELMTWFARAARDLPWRRTRDPYAIWVSEIMLQQTQVKTVVAFWERWMRSLPTIQSLAEAAPEKIHKLWEGLGYYTRVRNLQKAAQQIVAEHGGKFPRDYETILSLPGIGRYTAGAIASIAFNQPKPVLDGNVVRVLTRLFGIVDNPREKETNARLWGQSEALVATAAQVSRRAHTIEGDETCSQLNQSLMELGALVCAPKKPACPICPLRFCCAAFAAGTMEKLPNLGPRQASTSRRFMAFVLERRGRYLVRQRPAGVVNGHLWEFPNAEVTNSGRSETPPSAAKRILGATPTSITPLCVIKHAITRYRIRLEAFHCRVTDNARPHGTPGKWLTLNQLHELAFSSAHGKILRAVMPAKSRR